MLKEAKKMQAKMEELQNKLADETIEVSHAGGAIQLSINCASTPEIKSLNIDADFLKEDAEMVNEALMGAVNEALGQSQKRQNDAMSKATAGFQMPGF